jgi:hypothetical protein
MLPARTTGPPALLPHLAELTSGADHPKGLKYVLLPRGVTSWGFTSGSRTPAARWSSVASPGITSRQALRGLVTFFLQIAVVQTPSLYTSFEKSQQRCRKGLLGFRRNPAIL